MLEKFRLISNPYNQGTSILFSLILSPTMLSVFWRSVAICIENLTIGRTEISNQNI
jgi:hypothetical protein